MHPGCYKEHCPNNIMGAIRLGKLLEEFGQTPEGEAQQKAEVTVTAVQPLSE